MSRALAAAAALAAALAGCSAPGTGAYGFPERPPARPTDQGARAAPLEGAQRPLAIGQLDDLTIQPVGARYTEASMVDRVAPGAGIEQTYFYWAVTPKLRHALREALVAQGVRAFCDDTDLGLATPYGTPALPTGVLLLRGELQEFSYSRASGSDVLSAAVAWRLLDADSGRVVAQAQHQATVGADEAVEPGQEEDPFAVLAQRLGAQLLADPVIRSALLSKPWSGPASLEAGTPRREEDRR